MSDGLGALVRKAIEDARGGRDAMPKPTASQTLAVETPLADAASPDERNYSDDAVRPLVRALRSCERELAAAKVEQDRLLRVTDAFEAKLHNLSERLRDVMRCNKCGEYYTMFHECEEDEEDGS